MEATMATPAGKVDEAMTWKRCSTCRGPIAFARIYYVCSVSTCNRVRTTYRFCSVECWEEHLPLMRHREAWAVEETAPTREAWAAEESGAGAAATPVRPTEIAKAEVVKPTPAPAPASAPKPAPAPVASDPGGARRRIVGPAPKPAAASPAPAAAVAASGSDDVLVVVSRFKAYVRERFGMNTSDGVVDVLSDHLRAICHRAVENARTDGRKTLMDRDFEFLRRR
jgi:hypothetical protein